MKVTRLIGLGIAVFLVVQLNKYTDGAVLMALDSLVAIVLNKG